MRIRASHDLAGFRVMGADSDDTSCGPFKWNGDAVHRDLAWAYDFPTPAAAADRRPRRVRNELVDVSIDGELMSQPGTHVSRSAR